MGGGDVEEGFGVTCERREKGKVGSASFLDAKAHPSSLVLHLPFLTKDTLRYR